MYEKYRDLAVKDAEKAEEGEEKIQAEAIVKSWDEDLERLEKESWRLSPERIERYQKILPFCKVLDHDFQREVQSTITAQDAQLMGGEEDDNINIENFLNLMDQKMQMIRDEGK